MSNLCDSYYKILGLLHELGPEDDFLGKIRRPRLSDKELIVLSLVVEGLGLGSGRYLSKQLPIALACQIDRSASNRRRRRLKFMTGLFRQGMASALAPYEDTYFVDSLPPEVCKTARTKRSRICQEVNEGR